MTHNPAMYLLAQQLLAARQARVTLDGLDSSLLPRNLEDAYRAQDVTIAALGGAGAYKIGAKTPEQTPQYAPIPSSRLLTSGQEVARRDFSRIGLELEIAFRFKRAIDAESAGLSDAEILAQIEQMLVAVEIVDSRFKNPAEQDKLTQLADLQNNGALIVGTGVPYDPGFDFMAPVMSFSCGPQQIIAGRGRNPAGDPRRLLVWLVRQRLAEGRTIAAGAVLTTGSYSGIYYASESAEVIGEIAGIGRVSLSLL